MCFDFGKASGLESYPSRPSSPISRTTVNLRHSTSKLFDATAVMDLRQPSSYASTTAGQLEAQGFSVLAVAVGLNGVVCPTWANLRHLLPRRHLGVDSHREVRSASVCRIGRQSAAQPDFDSVGRGRNRRIDRLFGCVPLTEGARLVIYDRPLHLVVVPGASCSDLGGCKTKLGLAQLHNRAQAELVTALGEIQR
jgi:hypothetical protein